MTLKPCACCGRHLTTSQVKKVAKGDFIGGKSLYVNCKHCQSTMVLMLKPNAASGSSRAA